MKNIGTLYRYELKKLLKRKLNWAAILFIMALCAFGVVQIGSSGGFRFEDTDEQGNPVVGVISGGEVRAAKLSAMGTLNGQVMDDAFFQKMLERVPKFDDPYEELKYFYRVDSTYLNAYSMVDGLLVDERTLTAEKFYAAQWEQTQAYWEACGLTEAEKDYWTQQVEQIQKPYVYRHLWPGTSKLFDFFYTLLSLLPVAAAVCLCTVFSDDRRARADALVFSTRKSRVPLYLAKVLAGLTGGALAGAAVIGGTMAAHLAVWGAQGFGACVQFYETVCPRPITVGQMLLSMLLIMMLYTLVCGALTMLVSAMTRNAVAALAVPVVLVQLLARWNPPARGWTGYLPENLAGWNGPVNLQLVNIFGVYLNNFQFGPVLYLSMTAVLCAMCWLGWRRGWTGRL